MMTDASLQFQKKVMILCAGVTKSMHLSLSGLRQSSCFGHQVGDFIKDGFASLNVTWMYQEVEPINGCSINTPEYWLVLRKAIVNAVEVEGCSGVLVLHEVDTLTYGAAAMSYLLYRLPAVIIFTGAMVAIDAAESDVWENFTGGLILLAKGMSDGVYLYFHGDILRPLRSTKLKTSGRHPFVELDFTCQQDVPCLPNEVNYKRYMRPVSIGVLPLFPGLGSWFLESMLGSGIQALVLEHEGVELAVGEGFGHGLVGVLRNASAKGIVVVVISQCAGRSPYKLSADIRAAGVISGGYITREAMLGKLYALLGGELEQSQIRKYIED